MQPGPKMAGYVRPGFLSPGRPPVGAQRASTPSFAERSVMEGCWSCRRRPREALGEGAVCEIQLVSKFALCGVSNDIGNCSLFKVALHKECALMQASGAVSSRPGPGVVVLESAGLVCSIYPY